MLGDTGPARHARAGFLEGEAIGISLPIGPSNLAVVKPTRQVGLPVPSFKKTAPFEFIRCVWRLANTETRLCVLPSEVSKNKFKKGQSGFP